MQDRDTQRVYRLFDFTKAQPIPLDQAYCMARNGNSSDGRHRAIESVGQDARHARRSDVPVPVDGAGGSGIG